MVTADPQDTEDLAAAALTEQQLQVVRQLLKNSDLQHRTVIGCTIHQAERLLCAMDDEICTAISDSEQESDGNDD